MKSNQETIENYRKVIKHLKGKCQTLESLNKYLENQISHYVPNSEPLPPLQNNFVLPIKNFRLYNDCFSRIIVNGKAKIGDIFSLEMVFRMLDKDFQSRISSDSLSDFLMGPLEIPQMQVTRILLIFDENCNGFIQKKEYYKALDCFCCRSELEGPETVFSIDDLLKPFAEKLLSMKISPLQFFNMSAQSNESQHMMYEDFENLWKGNLLQLKELDLKELNMIVQVFDQEYKGFFSQISFLTQTNRIFRRLLGFSSANRRYLDSCAKELTQANEENAKLLEKNKEFSEGFSGDQGVPPIYPNKTPNITKKTDIATSNNKVSKKVEPTSSNKKDKFNKENKENDLIFSQDEAFQGDQALADPLPDQQVKRPEKSKNKESIVSGTEILISAAIKSGKHVYLCYEAILADAKQPQLGFTVNEIFSKLDYYYGAYLNKQAKIEILKSIDLNNNGVYDFFELKAFFLEACQGKVSVKTLLLSFAKELQAKRISTKELFRLNGIDFDEKMNLKRFIEEVKPLMDLEFGEISAVFLEICDSEATISAGEFINIIDSLRNDTETLEKDTNFSINGSKQENWSIQVKRNNMLRKIVATFCVALKAKNITGKDLMKRLNQDGNNKNLINLSKLSEVLKRILPEKSAKEISEFLDILDEKRTGVITLDNFERIINFEEQSIEVRPLKESEKDELKEKLTDFLDRKSLNMHQFFELIDKECKGQVNFNEIKEGLLSQGFSYIDASRFISMYDTNHDGLVECQEFIEAFTFSSPSKNLVHFKDFPIAHPSNNLTSYDQSNKKVALQKMKKLIDSKEFCLLYEKHFGKFKEIRNFAVTKDEFSNFLSLVPQPRAYKENIMLSPEEIATICLVADSNRRNQIKMEAFFDFIRGLKFENEKDEMGKIKQFLQEIEGKDPFTEEKMEFSPSKNEKERLNVSGSNTKSIREDHHHSNSKERQEPSHNEHDQLEERNTKNIWNAEEEEDEILKRGHENYENTTEKQDKNSSFAKKNENLQSQLVDQKKYLNMIESKQNELLQKLKLLSEDLKKLKATKNDLFTNERKDYFTMFKNPIICLKRMIEEVLALKKEGEFWKDNEFGPSNSDPSGVAALFKNTHKKPENFVGFDKISWRHLYEISTFPQFTNPEDPFNSPILQGEIGDSWLLGAIQLVSSRPYMVFGDEKTSFNALYPKIFHFLRFWGIYVFRFYKDLTWVYVVIDDLLPCLELQKGHFSLLFAGNDHPQEFWVALLEKAMAKLHHSYQSLESGNFSTALRDFTGYYIKNLRFSKSDDYLFLSTYAQRHSLVSCSKWGSGESSKEELGQGLRENMAYLVQGTVEVKDETCKNRHKSHRLCVMKRWEGDDSVPLKWIMGGNRFERNKKAIGEEIRKEIEAKKAFLLGFKCFRSFFDETLAVFKYPTKRKEYCFFEEWNKNNSWGPPMLNDPKKTKNWTKNLKIFINLNRKEKAEKTKIFIEMSQPDPRLRLSAHFPFSTELHFLFFVVLKHEQSKGMKIEKFEPANVVYTSPMSKSREISEELTIENGCYLIVVNSDQPGVTGNFLLRLVADCDDQDIKILEEKGKISISQQEISPKDQELLNRIPEEDVLEVWN